MWCLRNALAQALGWTEGDENWQSMTPEHRYPDALTLCERFGLTVHQYVYGNGRWRFGLRGSGVTSYPEIKPDGRYIIFHIVGEPPNLEGHVTFLDAGADAFVEELKSLNRLRALVPVEGVDL